MPSLRLSPVRTVLPNGLTVLTRTTRPQSAVAIHLSVPAGSVFDPPAREGLANFVACVIDRGTDSQPADAIAEAFDLRGVSLQARASRHRLSLACDCLTEDFEAVMSLLGTSRGTRVFRRARSNSDAGKLPRRSVAKRTPRLTRPMTRCGP